MAALPDESHIAMDFTPYVPRLVIEWLAENPDREWREVDGTMAFVDISGFTAMSEKLATQGKAGAEQVTEVMNTTFDALLRRRVRLRRRPAQVRRRRTARLLRRRGPRAARGARGVRDAEDAALDRASEDDRRDRDAEDARRPQFRPLSLHARRRRASRADRQWACRNDHGRDGGSLGGRRDPPRPWHSGRPARRGARRRASGRLPPRGRPGSRAGAEAAAARRRARARGMRAAARPRPRELGPGGARAPDGRRGVPPPFRHRRAGAARRP